ncbi:glycoside hydrolase family 2 protein [Marinilabilia rubra]|uniref:beta-galactosidase n=1 Tax=Marinilabilia rubra TaxID=2162893 RepID=A0A2U2B5G0_9BACT|nr:glycoside hydrolase family 2 TIM barrel-domain containing protein [Marinilabilia rubra]PWD98308.1 glycoside hydrolase family 2 [Marinilabilia rubra]
MKIIKLLVILLVSTSMVKAQYSFDRKKTETIRWSPLPKKVQGIEKRKVDLNGSWHFNASPEQAFWKKKSAHHWSEIEVPGEWVMQGFQVDTGKYAGYHRQFELPDSWDGYRVKLKCEAVYSDCKIWINGQKVGNHLGGFTAFEIDVTDALKRGTNTIALAVRSESLADTLSSASQYAVHPLGGITRPISLVALSEVNLASFHVQTVFDENYEDATIIADLKLSNESRNDQRATLNFSLTDAENNMVPLKGEKRAEIFASPGNNAVTVKLKVKNPAKWDPEHPNLYHLNCSVKTNGKEQTKISKRFGFRQIEVRKNKVFVNNHPIKLKGVCRHEVHPQRGRSLTGNIWYNDVKLFKEGNVNYIRTSHYPPNQKLLDACDELGMFVEEEAPFCWAHEGPVNDSNYFEAILQPTLEMIERDKSHPSILMWSLANESHNFEELYKQSADLVKTADPSRPRVFSMWSENMDNGYLEINNDHYCGPDGPAKYAKQKRPITFDEYCHLNAYNRIELITDPGVRDFWGEGFMMMWEKMHQTEAVLGGALWAGIDDTFFLPSGKPVGYGTWGPVDGWRRKKPEFWHMKKVYSPVKIHLLSGNQKEPVRLQVENRYLFSNLSECKIQWKNAEKSGILNISLEAGKTKEFQLPLIREELEQLTIDVFKDGDTPVDQYLFSSNKPEILWTQKNNTKFKSKDQITESNNFSLKIEDGGLSILDKNGDQILKDLPELMLIPLTGEGDGIQMTKDTPEFELFSPGAGHRNIQSFTVDRSKEQVRINITESYDKANGKMVITIFPSGLMTIVYDYVITEALNPRQWGIRLSLAEELQSLSWKRDGLWSVYPENHIGRNKGMASAFNQNPECGLAGPAQSPSWSWKNDQTSYGTNDFRSTKRNIFQASLLNASKSGIRLKGAGLQHIRCWMQTGGSNLLIAEYDNPGAERFFRSHAKQWDRPLKKGDRIQGTVKIEIMTSNE